jgi:aspartate racemase
MASPVISSAGSGSAVPTVPMPVRIPVPPAIPALPPPPWQRSLTLDLPIPPRPTPVPEPDLLPLTSRVGRTRIGIWGGMGPDAGDQFVLRFMNACKKTAMQAGIPWSDQMAPSYFLLSAPVPDRTAAIMDIQNAGATTADKDPFPMLQRLAVESQMLGATHVLMVCNTVHYWLGKLQDTFPNLKFVSLIETTVTELKKRHAHKVALMATTGTVKSGIYQKALEAAGMEVAPIPDEIQTMTMEGIYQGVKANNYPLARQRLETVARYYMNQGVDALILGCTEIPEAGMAQDILAKSVDPNQAAAERLARIAYGLEKSP